MDTSVSDHLRQESYATHNTVDREKDNYVHQDNDRAITASQRILKHLGRFKWVYVIVGAIVSVLAIILPVLFAVVVPHMIQDAINNSELPLLSSSVEAVSPTHVRFGLSTELKNPQNLGVTLDAFPMELYNVESDSKDTIVTLNFPEQYLDKRSTSAVEIVPQTLEIQSQSELRKFLLKSFRAQQTTIGVRGSTHARVLGGSHAVTLNKEVSLDGLRNLEGMKVDTLIPTPPGGANSTLARDDPLNSIATMNGSLTVPNPSKLTLALGDITYNVYGAGMLLGESHVNDLRLVPGDQVIPYRGTLNVDDIVDVDNHYEAFSKLMETVTDEGRVPFDIVGNVTYVNGEHIGYLDEVLSQIKLHVEPCLETTQKAIPANKQYLQMALYIPMDKKGICDPNSRVS